MVRRHLHKTLVDYLVIAISPALIMTLVGSLVFFLLEVFYRGNFQGRLEYIFALFVIGRRLDRPHLHRAKDATMGLFRRSAGHRHPAGHQQVRRVPRRRTGVAERPDQLWIDRPGLVVGRQTHLGLHADRRERRGLRRRPVGGRRAGPASRDVRPRGRPIFAANVNAKIDALRAANGTARAGGDHFAGRAAGGSGGNGSSNAAVAHTPPAFGSSISRWPQWRSSASASFSSLPTICRGGSMPSACSASTRPAAWGCC